MSVALAILAGIGIALGSGLILLALLRLDWEEDLGRVSPGYLRARGWGPNVVRFDGARGRTSWPASLPAGRAITPREEDVRFLALRRRDR